MNSSAQSRKCDEACSDEQVFVGLDAEPSAAMDANFWKAEWFKLHAIRGQLLETRREVEAKDPDLLRELTERIERLQNPINHSVMRSYLDENEAENQIHDQQTEAGLLKRMRNALTTLLGKPGTLT